MIKYLSILVLIPILSYAADPDVPPRSVSARTDDLAVSITRTRLEYIGDLVKEFKDTCGHFPKSVESLFEPDKDSCPLFPRLTTAYTLLDGWDRTFQLVVRGQGAYVISYGADDREGGLGGNKDLAVQIEGI